MKPGWKTSEFWLTLAVLVAKAMIPSLSEKVIYVAGAYALSRGIAKAAQPAADAEGVKAS